MQNIISTNFRNGKLSLRTFFSFLIILLVVIGATWRLARSYYDNSKATDRAISRLDSSLINCNRFLQINNRLIANEMANKLRDPATVEKASIWKPKSDSVFAFSNSMQLYVESLRQQLNEEIDNKKKNTGRISFDRSNVSSILFDSLNNFTQNLIQLIPEKKRNQLALLPVQRLLANDKINKQNWQNDYFGQISEQATLVLLSKIESDVLSSGNIVMDYINNQTANTIHNCIRYLPFTTQNSTCFLPGQTLEITVGIDSYDYSINPTITIDNKKIINDVNSIGTYKKLITGSKGGSIPVIIYYTDPSTGQALTLSKKINYTVFQPPKK